MNLESEETESTTKQILRRLLFFFEHTMCITHVKQKEKHLRSNANARRKREMWARSNEICKM